MAYKAHIKIRNIIFEMKYNKMLLVMVYIEAKHQKALLFVLSFQNTFG